MNFFTWKFVKIRREKWYIRVPGQIHFRFGPEIQSFGSYSEQVLRILDISLRIRIPGLYLWITDLDPAIFVSDIIFYISFLPSSPVISSRSIILSQQLKIFGRALLGCFWLYQLFVKTNCQWNNFPSQSSLMRKQFIVGSFKDPGFGNFVKKLWFEKSKWFD